MRKCDLCNSPAKLSCESDQASLCWKCDAKVHSANFLVTKHPRILLCHVCQSLTAWQGTGPKFVPTISICNTCVNNNSGSSSRQIHDEDDDDNDDGVMEDHAENDEGGVEEDDEENQVVPWTSTPPPPASTSSNSVATASTSSSNVEEGTSD